MRFYTLRERSRHYSIIRLMASAAALYIGIAAMVPISADAAWVRTAGQDFTPDASLGAVALEDQKPMHVLVSLKRQNQELLNSTVKNLFIPGNPQYHQFLSVDDRIRLFSPSQAQVDRVAAYLQSMGFNNITVSKGRTLIQADGTASIAAKAFNTSFVKFKQDKEEVFANTATAQVPDTIGDTVLAINGLQNVWRMHTALELERKRLSKLGPVANISPAQSKVLDIVRKAQAQTPVRAKLTSSSAGAKASLMTSSATAAPCGPVAAGSLSNIDIIEGFPPTAWDIAYDAGCTSDGSGSTIAISVYGDDMTQVIADLRQMEKSNGYPFVPVEVRITTAITTPDTSGDDEWDLDSQSSTAIAGNVKKLIFYSTDVSSDLVSEYTAFADNGDAIAGNMSYGSCDALNPVLSQTGILLPAATASDPEFMAAVMEGLSWFASTGDDGGSCSPVNAEGIPDAGVPGGANYPATSPYVTAVGGTSLFTDANYNYIEETAWTSGGGGISAIEQAPSWQTTSGAVPSALVGGAASFKGVPDIAMNAGVYVPEAVVESSAQTVVNGAVEDVVGTSLSSPLATGAWARFQASHCQKLSFAAEVYYSLDTTTGPLSGAAGFNDITLGSNGTYEATPGWDYTTGFGTLDLTNVDKALDTSAAHCTPNASIPTAVLTSSQTVGTTTEGASPFAVNFSGAGSSDSTGLSIDYYAIDFGDGSPIVVQAAAAPAKMPKDTVDGTAARTTTYGPNLTHTYAAPGTYTATLTVRNSVGNVSTNVAQLVITVDGVPEACTLPGELIVPASAAVSGVEGMDLFAGADLLQGTYFSEPASGNGQLFITMNIADLSVVYPELRWITYFDVKGDTTMKNYYVSMDTSTGTPAFTYGLHTLLPIAGDSEYMELGTLDAASTDNAAAPGTITLVLDLNSIPLTVGDTLTSISSAVRTTTPDDPTGTIPGGEGLTQDSSGATVNYTLIGNAACAAATTGGGTTGSSTGGTSGGSSTGGISGGSTGGTSGGTSGGTTGGVPTGGTSGGTSTGGAGGTGSSTGNSSGGDTTGGTTGGIPTGGTSGGTSAGSSTGGTSTGGAGGTGSSTGNSSGGDTTGGTTGGGQYHGFFGGGSFGEVLAPLALLAGLRRRRQQSAKS